MTRTAAPTVAAPASRPRGLVLIGVAIVLTGLNLRTAVTSIGPVLREIEDGLGISSGLAGLVTTMPVLCFAAIGFAGPGLSARFRDSHVLSAALATMAVGLVVRAIAPAFWLFLLGTVLAMVGGALGNVLLPSLVKRYFPARTGLMVGAYSTAMSVGATVAAVSTAPVAAAIGDDGWRWALGVWALFALLAAGPWLFVRATPGASRGTHVAVRMRDLRHSRMALALMVFFGVQGLQAYVIIGWSASYLRDAGLTAAAAGLLLGLNQVIGIPLSALVPALTVRPRLQRPLLLTFMACYTVGWTGLWVAPRTAPWLWMAVLSVAMASFPMILTLIGLRARTPETTAALSTFVQSWGYVISAVGPLLVGVLLGATGSYVPMFVLVLAGVLVLAVTGWFMTRERYADDEVNRNVAGWSSSARCEDVLEVAGVEAPASAHVGTDDAPRGGASPRG
ncbi:CynX/NimT family MFS transporter [Blastococcus litoris]|uniref:MFS transporter n=1 Tax=Blastococcus litoris TaxID=2171622 RepID=UPI000E30860E|nr:MFS transporter [Blastococcus litoris]